MPDSPDLDPERIHRREFTTTFRGFDQAEVRGFLITIADQLQARVEREQELLTRLAEAESRPPSLDDVDEHHLTELLGEETARIFEAAREAAAEIRAKAESKTAQLVRDAQDEAHRMTHDASEVLRLRTAEAETAAAAIVSDAEAERDRILDEARVEAEAVRVEATTDAERMRDEAEHLRAQAESDVEAVLEHARQQGREMVAEAQVVRERILKDLARRRRAGKAQLEQLRAARERMLDAYALVRRTVEEATTELSVAVPEAKLAADAAGRRVEADESELSVEDIEAELDAGRVAGVPLLDTGEVPVVRPGPGAGVADTSEVGVDEVDDGPVDEIAVGADVGEAVDVDAEAVAGSEDEPEDHAEDPSANEVPPAPPGPGHVDMRPQEPVLSLVREPDRRDEPGERDDLASAEPGAQSDEASDAIDVVEAEAYADPGDDDGTEVPSEVEASDAIDVVEAEAYADPGDDEPDLPGEEAGEGEEPAGVEALFARLRSEVPEPDPDGPDPEGFEEADLPGTVPTSEATDEIEPDAEIEDDRAGEGELSDDPDERALDARDQLIAALERDLARGVKRQLADDENDKLDQIRRRSSKAATTDVLPTLDEHRTGFAAITVEVLAASATAGTQLAAQLLDDDREAVLDLSVDVDDLAVELAETLLLPIRERVSELARSDDPEVLDGVRACYRRWRGSIPELAAQYVHTAFNRGVFAAIPDGTPVRWVVDPGAGPCPDGEDDALEGPIARGTPFPTGHLHPPAHPGCRCLLVPGVL